MFGNNVPTPNNKPNSGFQFSSQKPGLFGNSNANAATPSPVGSGRGDSGGLFGGSTKMATGTGGGGFFGGGTGGTTTGGLFGSNTAATNGAPSMGATGGGLFGNKPADSGASGGLFGSKPSASAGSLFGNNSTATSTMSGGSSLFGNNTTIGSNTGVGSGGLFGAKPATATSTNIGGLFGNSSTLNSNNNNNANSSLTFGQQNTPNPYGLNLNVTPAPVTVMPESITSKLPNKTPDLIPTDKTLSNAKRNPLTTPSSVKQNISQSSLINKLNSRLQTGSTPRHSQETFSHSKLNMWTEIGKDKSNSARNNGHSSLQSINSIATPNKNLSEMRKLKIEPSRIAAKKLKLLSGTKKPTKLVDSTLDRRENAKHDSEELKIDSEKSNKHTNGQEEKNVAFVENENTSGYWCSPSIFQLSKYSHQQLSDVPNFVIGREGYGCITFNFPVDLSKFADNLEESLFGKIVKFNDSRTVEVYPSDCDKPRLGRGLNVPATITLDNVYPVDKSTKLPLKDISKIDELQNFIEKLRKMRGMEFISYNLHTGSWTFKVKHFSIWGMIDEDDEDEDMESSEKNNSIKYGKDESNKALAKYSESSFQEEDDEYMNDDNEDEDEDIDFEEVEKNNNLIVAEKAFEPIIDETNFDGLEANPLLDTSKNWMEQLRLANDSLRSIFLLKKSSDESRTAKHSSSFFSSFDEKMEKERKIMEDRRLDTSYSIAKFDFNYLTYTNREQEIKLTKFNGTGDNNNILMKASYDKHLSVTTFTERSSNKFPTVMHTSLSFKLLSDVHIDHDLPYKSWELCSILFDENKKDSFGCNEDAKAVLWKKYKYKLLCQWISREIREEIEEKVRGTTDDLEKVFLYLAMNDVISASKLAMNSNNPHLAVLITYLGSNDPRIKSLAVAQLKKWDSLGNAVDEKIKHVYQLLGNCLFDDASNRIYIENNFSWLAQLGLNLFYSEIDENSLEILVSKILSQLAIVENKFYHILNIFSSKSERESIFIQSASNMSFDIQFSWYFVQILKSQDPQSFSNEICDKLTLSFIEQLRSLQLHSQALYVSCFLIDDHVAEQQIELIIYHEIQTLYDQPNQYVLNRLKIPKSLVHKALASLNHYHSDYYSEVDNLLKAEDFVQAETVLSVHVAPRLVLNGGNELQTLHTLISDFDKNKLQNWDKRLGVFDEYLKMTSTRSITKAQLSELITGLVSLHQEYITIPAMTVCCSVMSQQLFRLVCKTLSSNLDPATKQKLLQLPIGQAEKTFMESVLAGISTESSTLKMSEQPLASNS